MATDGDTTDRGDSIDRRTRGGTSRLADSRHVLPPQIGKSPGSRKPRTRADTNRDGWWAGWWNGTAAKPLIQGTEAENRMALGCSKGFKQAFMGLDRLASSRRIAIIVFVTTSFICPIVQRVPLPPSHHFLFFALMLRLAPTLILPLPEFLDPPRMLGR